jgi:hypothetical protein
MRHKDQTFLTYSCLGTIIPNAEPTQQWQDQFLIASTSSDLEDSSPAAAVINIHKQIIVSTSRV